MALSRRAPAVSVPPVFPRCMQYLSRRRTLGYASALALSLFSVVAATSHGSAPTARARVVADSLRGRSGKLLVRFVVPNDGATPGIYPVSDSTLARPFSFIALHPFASKQGATLGNYRIGYWPGERRQVSPAYANPLGFIEVTEANADTRISEHFRLRDFLTHDQARVWPKYLVLREDLIDKLELVIAELEAEGHPVRHMTVMSGFRTPQYNANGGITSGRAEMSRHMYGDASDVFVDNDGNGTMDDLNGDGRVDYRDAQVIVAAAERVENAHRDLLGGGGVYKATREHGPFAHIDVRGNRARWGLVQ